MAERLSAEERRVGILEAAQRLFAEKGFHGATTRDLAEAAGVSEALIFKYFPTKDRLYDEMLAFACRHCAEERAHWKALPPSTATLAILVHRLMGRMVQVAKTETESGSMRLMLQSLLADGAFARQFLAIISETSVEALTRSLVAAAKSGDCDAAPGSHDEARLRAWTALHAAVMSRFYRLPRRPVLDYRIDAEALVPAMTRFCLRGLGLSERAIARAYQPEALAVLES